MTYYNTEQNKIILKLVYYGPDGSGKSSNLEFLAENLTRGESGELMSLGYKSGRLLFLDCSLEGNKQIKGMDVAAHLYSFAGGLTGKDSFHRLLEGVNGLVFVVDSQKDRNDDNREAFEEFRKAVEYLDMDITKIPMVLQFNKRDLEDVESEERLDDEINDLNCPFYSSVASQGIRVEETLEGLFKLAAKDLDDKLNEDEDMEFITYSSLDDIFKRYEDAVRYASGGSDGEEYSEEQKTVDEAPDISQIDENEELELLESLFVGEPPAKSVEESEEKREENAEVLFDFDEHGTEDEDRSRTFDQLDEEDISTGLLDLGPGDEEGVLEEKETLAGKADREEEKKPGGDDLYDLGHENWLQDGVKQIRINIDRKVLEKRGGAVDKSVTIPVAINIGEEKVNLSLNLELRLYFKD